MDRLKEYSELLSTPAAQKIISLDNQPIWPELPQGIIPQEFPLSALPPVGRDMVKAVAEAMQVHPDMVACFLLGALSTCIVGRGKVLIRPGYAEPLQIYIAVAANPSERKSPAIAKMFNPIYEYETQRVEEMRPLLRDTNARLGMKKKQLDLAQRKGQESAALSIACEIEELESIRPFELIIGEGTPEAIVEKMAENGGRIAVVSAEGGLLDILAGMYAESKVNLDPVLQGYSGEPINSARVSRKSSRIQSASLSITLAVQPVTMEALLSNELLVRRGVVGRFLLSYPPSTLGKRNSSQASPVPDAICTRYTRQLDAILRRNDICLTLSPGALRVFDDWDKKVESRLSPDNDLDRLPAGWGGKILGNTARIAGLLCLLEGQGDVVEEFTMQAAVTISEYFISQEIFLSGSDALVGTDATEILQHLIRKQQSEFIPYKLRQSLRSRSRFKKAESVYLALKELEQAGYIRRMIAPEYNGKGRKPEAMFQLNPALLKREISEVLEL